MVDSALDFAARDEGFPVQESDLISYRILVPLNGILVRATRGSATMSVIARRVTSGALFQKQKTRSRRCLQNIRSLGIEGGAAFSTLI